MAGRTREWYKIEPRISVPFMLELKYESKIIFKNYLWLKKYVLGCKRSVPSTRRQILNFENFSTFSKTFSTLILGSVFNDYVVFYGDKV